MSEEDDKLLDIFEEIADKYYGMLLEIHYRKPYFTKAQNERVNQFLQNRLVITVEKMGVTDEQIVATASKIIILVTDENR